VMEAHGRLDEVTHCLRDEAAVREDLVAAYPTQFSASDIVAQQAAVQTRLDGIEDVIANTVGKYGPLEQQVSTVTQLLDQNMEDISSYLSSEKGQREALALNVREHIAREEQARASMDASISDHIKHEQRAREQNSQMMEEVREMFSQADQGRKQDGMHDRVESLSRSISIFDGLIRKEMEERVKENSRIWDALDNHTHDLSPQVVAGGAVGTASGGAAPPPPYMNQAPSSPIGTTAAMESQARRLEQLGQTPASMSNLVSEPISPYSCATAVSRPGAYPTMSMKSVVSMPSQQHGVRTASDGGVVPVTVTVDESRLPSQGSHAGGSRLPSQGSHVGTMSLMAHGQR